MDDFNFKDIFDNIPTGVLILDSEQKIIHANQYFYKKFTFKPEDLINKTLLSILDNENTDRTTLKKHVCYFIEEQAMDNRLMLLRKSEKPTPIEISFRKYNINQHEIVLCKIDDITVQNAYERVIQAGYDQMQKVTIELEKAIKKIEQQKIELQAYKEKLKRELKLACLVQETIFPKSFPELEGLELYGISKPSQELGGDYYDIFHLENNKIGLVVADVSGHGVAASLLTTMLKAHFEHYTSRYDNPEDVLFHINNSLASMLKDSGIYLTALYGVIDVLKSKLYYCSAGHESALIFEPEQEKPLKIEDDKTGSILGLEADKRYKAFEYPLKPGNRVLFFTDGIAEARNKDDLFWGIDNLIDYFQKNQDLSCRECLNNLFNIIDDFYGGVVPNDDRTIIYFKINKAFLKNREKNSQRHIQYINTLLSQKEYNKAVNYIESLDFEKVMEKDFYFIKAKAYYLANRLYQSEENIKFCLNLDPDNITALYLLGIIYYRTEEYKRAINYWEKVIKINKNFKKTTEYIYKAKVKAGLIEG